MGRNLDDLSDRELFFCSLIKGEIHSIGMPDSWGNWSTIWTMLKNHYYIKQKDQNLSSAEALSDFKNPRDTVRILVMLGDPMPW
ncbi:hypothetical protein [Eubacterium aggregans]|uniref:hypothetical protein n=1 Tax=Eubacterium aggregans TaxID=81409 RepID=UPI003F3BE719